MREQAFDPKDHWEALFDKTYLRWFHLMGQDVEVEIESVQREELTMPGGRQQKKGVVHFKQKPGREKPKPLVLNNTNAAAIANLHGDKPSKWPGKKITLYPTTTRMYSQALKKMETVGCIRVRLPEKSKNETVD